MSRDGEFRPALIAEGLVPTLGDLLAFRRYFIHGSIVDSPRSAQLIPLRESVLSVRVQLASDLDCFDQHLTALIAASRE